MISCVGAIDPATATAKTVVFSRCPAIAYGVTRVTRVMWRSSRPAPEVLICSFSGGVFNGCHQQE